MVEPGAWEQLVALEALHKCQAPAPAVRITALVLCSPGVTLAAAVPVVRAEVRAAAEGQEAEEVVGVEGKLVAVPAPRKAPAVAAAADPEAQEAMAARGVMAARADSAAEGEAHSVLLPAAQSFSADKSMRREAMEQTALPVARAWGRMAL